MDHVIPRTKSKFNWRTILLQINIYRFNLSHDTRQMIVIVSRFSSDTENYVNHGILNYVLNEKSKFLYCVFVIDFNGATTKWPIIMKFQASHGQWFFELKVPSAIYLLCISIFEGDLQ